MIYPTDTPPVLTEEPMHQPCLPSPSWYYYSHPGQACLFTSQNAKCISLPCIGCHVFDLFQYYAVCNCYKRKVALKILYFIFIVLWINNIAGCSVSVSNPLDMLS